MIKTVKGKVIAGTIAVTLLSGAGVAFGASGAGENLKAWFETQFGIAKNDMETEVTDYANEKKEALNAEFNELKTGATTKINTTEGTARSSANSNIEQELNEHLESIDTKKVELERYMNNQFSRILKDAEQRIFDAGTEASRKALNTELSNTTNKAVTDLRTAIENAKSGLQSKLDEKSSDTTDEIKVLIDDRVEEVSVWVTMMTNFMVQEREDLIIARALELENTAIVEMQSLVDGI